MTLRVVRFSRALVVMPRAFVRSCSFVAVFPVLGRLVISVRSLADVVVTLRVVCSRRYEKLSPVHTVHRQVDAIGKKNADSSMSLFFNLKFNSWSTKVMFMSLQTCSNALLTSASCSWSPPYCMAAYTHGNVIKGCVCLHNTYSFGRRSNLRPRVYAMLVDQSDELFVQQ